MNDKQVFVDTNILVYALDKQAGRKHQIAGEKILQLWDSTICPAISIQVLQELYVNLVKKGVSDASARKVVEDYLEWNVVVNDEDLLLDGMRIKERYKMSFWDSLIIAAAQSAGAAIIWSEDLQDGQMYDGVIVCNPLRV